MPGSSMVPAWFRKKMKALRPEVVPWPRQAVREMSRNYDVAGLCREFPERLAAVRDGDGNGFRNESLSES